MRNSKNLIREEDAVAQALLAGHRTYRAIASATGISLSKTTRTIKRMIATGAITRNGRTCATLRLNTTTVADADGLRTFRVIHSENSTPTPRESQPSSNNTHQESSMSEFDYDLLTPNQRQITDYLPATAQELTIATERPNDHHGRGNIYTLISQANQRLRDHNHPWRILLNTITREYEIHHISPTDEITPKEPPSVQESTQLVLNLLRMLGPKNLPSPVTEYKFHPNRRWRFDLAWPDHKLAIEIDGGVWVQGRHVRGTGFEEDCDKLNAATTLGWAVYRFTPQMLDRDPHSAIKHIVSFLEKRRP